MTGSIFPLPVGNLVLLRRSKRALESKGLHLEFAPAGNIKLIPDEGASAKAGQNPGGAMQYALARLS